MQSIIKKFIHHTIAINGKGFNAVEASLLIQVQFVISVVINEKVLIAFEAAAKVHILIARCSVRVQ